jgi:hypothetical protein
MFPVVLPEAIKVKKVPWALLTPKVAVCSSYEFNLVCWQ